jgi:hypothetical protein
VRAFGPTRRLGTAQLHHTEPDWWAHPPAVFPVDAPWISQRTLIPACFSGEAVHTETDVTRPYESTDKGDAIEAERIPQETHMMH